MWIIFNINAFKAMSGKSRVTVTTNSFQLFGDPTLNARYEEHKMSPLSTLEILKLVYKYWLRDLVINKIRVDRSYENLLEFIDRLVGYDSHRKDGECRWADF